MKFKNYLLFCAGAFLATPSFARTPDLPKPPGMSERSYAAVNARYQAYTRAARSAGNTAAKITATPQRVTGMAYSEWSGGSPMLVDSVSLTYSGSRGSRFSDYMLYYAVSNLADQPGEVEYRDSYVHYDTMKSFSPSGSLMQRSWRSYDASSRVTLAETELLQRQLFSYLPNGKLSKVITIADQGSGMDSLQREYYIYDASGFVLRDSLEAFDSSTMSWVPAVTFLFNHNGAGQLLSFQVDFSLAGSALTFQRSDYSYAPNGKMSRIVSQMLNFSTFILEEQSKDSIGYSGNAQVYEDRWVADATTGVLTLDFQERRRLNARGLPDSVSQVSLQGGTSGYMKLSYDVNAYPTTATFYEFGSTTPDNQTRYYYEPVATAVPEVRQLKALQLAPNPALNVIRLDNKLGARFRVLDLNGRLMMEGSTGAAARIDIGALMPGIYTVLLTDNAGESFSGRFVKQ